jgi:hypothetical protein
MLRPRRLALLATSAVAAAAALAPAANAMTVSLGEPTLTARLAISQPVTVNCSAFDPSLVHYASSVSLQASQASGREIAHGFGGAFGFIPNLLYPCDGADHTVTGTVTADPSGPPFHGGKVLVSAWAMASAGTPCNPENTCFFGIQDQTATTGPTALKLH